MKQALELCSLACNSAAPSPTAGMVKIEDGFMVSYGGLMCIRVPVKFAFGCAFNPTALKTFYRKERTGLSYSVKKNKLLIQEGKERITVPCLPPSEMVTVDAIAPLRKLDFSVKMLRYASTVADPAHVKLSAQGVSLDKGQFLACNSRVFIIIDTDLPKDLYFNIHRDACAALAKFKSKVVGIASDNHLVKFVFEDNSSLTTHIIAEELPSLQHLIDYPRGPVVKLPDDVVDDLLKIDCHRFILTDGAIAYQNEDESVTGRIEVPGVQGPPLALRKENFHYILRNGGKITRDSENRFLRSSNGPVTMFACASPV